MKKPPTTLRTDLPNPHPDNRMGKRSAQASSGQRAAFFERILIEDVLPQRRPEPSRHSLPINGQSHDN